MKTQYAQRNEQNNEIKALNEFEIVAVSSPTCMSGVECVVLLCV